MIELVKKLKVIWNKIVKNSVIKSIVWMILGFSLAWGIFYLIIQFVIVPIWNGINWIG